MKQRKAGIILTYGNEAIKILTVLIYTPIVLRLLGQEEYGLYQMVSSVVAYLGLMNFGFGSAYIRFYARCRDGEEQAKLNGMFLLIFTGLAVLCLLCGGWLAGNARLVFGSGLTAAELEKARSLLTILVGNLALTLLNTVFDCHIYARERFGFQNLLRMAQSILNPFLALPLLLLRYGSWALAVVSLGLTLLTLGFNVNYCRKQLCIAFSFRNLRFGLLKELWIFTFFLFLNQVIDQVNWSLDRFLLGRMCGTASVAVYGIGGQINTLFIQLSTAVSAVFVPKVHRMAAESDSGEAFTNLMIRVGRIQLSILLLVLTGFLFFGRPFLLLWAGSGYEESYFVALLLMIPMTVPLVQNLGVEIQRAKNKHRARSLVYALLAAGNLALSVMLIPRWGCVGAAVGTAVTQILGTTVFMNWYYQKKIGLDMVWFWKEMAHLTLPLFPVFFLGGGYALCAQIPSWGGLLRSICLYTLGYCAVLGRQIKKRDSLRTIPPGVVNTISQ